MIDERDSWIAAAPATSVRRKLVVSTLLGLMGLASSLASPTFSFPPHTVSITWCHTFPLMAALAYGSRWGVVASLLGLAAFHPFVCWPTNGYANLVPFALEIILCAWHGYCADRRRERRTWWNHPLVAHAPFAGLFAASVFILYPVLFPLNPPFWTSTAATTMPVGVIVEILTKSTITIYGCVLLTAFLLKTPEVCRLLGVTSLPQSRYNGRVFAASFLSMVSVWLLWQTLNAIFVHADFPRGILRVDSAAEIITLFVALIASLIGGYVVTMFVEKRYAAETRLTHSETKYRTLFEAASDAIFLVKDGRFIECNQQATQMFSRPRAQIIGRSPADLSPPMQHDGRQSTAEAADKLRLAIAGQPQRFEWCHTRADNSRFEAEVGLHQIDHRPRRTAGSGGGA